MCIFTGEGRFLPNMTDFLSLVTSCVFDARCISARVVGESRGRGRSPAVAWMSLEKVKSLK